MASTERLYTAEDLEGKTKKELTEIVIEKWPEPTFNSSRTKKNVMVQKIVENGFSMSVLPVSLHVQSEGGYCKDIVSLLIKTYQTPQLPPPRPESVHADDPPLLEFHSLDLLIEDLSEEPPNKFIQQVSVPSGGPLDMGQWLVNTTELLSASQRSPASLNGPVKLAVEDQEPGWKRHFVKITGVNLCLLQPINTLKREHFPSQDEKNGGPSTATPQKKYRPVDLSLKCLSIKRFNFIDRLVSSLTSHADQEDVDWKGYVEFQKNQGRKLANKGRVMFWRFAAQFVDEHFGIASGAEGKEGKLVKKVSVKAALVMSASALSEAEKMTKILKGFDEGGEKRAQEVVEQAAAETTDGLSSSGFKYNLANWPQKWHKSLQLQLLIGIKLD
ncbi:hypothetical protein B0H19DRAFT_1081106 [Mycena capillaripes]|nr:hypothetical protein B0H19DRAFT_1081106 [Mycena capillaripes]